MHVDAKNNYFLTNYKGVADINKSPLTLVVLFSASSQSFSCLGFFV